MVLTSGEDGCRVWRMEGVDEYEPGALGGQSEILKRNTNIHDEKKSWGVGEVKV